jgi:hypothetical protein
MVERPHESNTVDFQVLPVTETKWSRSGLNRRPPACHAGGRRIAATDCGLDENRVTRSVTLRGRNRLPARPDHNCVAVAIGCHEGRHRGDGCCQYEET